MNHMTGAVFGSGPLWGEQVSPFDIVAALEAHDSQFSWHVVNDVTAALLSHIQAEPSACAQRTTLVTVSSGIAARTYDARTATVVVDTTHGIQGEIGHLPADFSLGGAPLRLRCDCGSFNHVSSYSSGRGIQNVLAAARHRFGGPGDWQVPASVAGLARAIGEGDPLATRLLDSVTAPLARVLATALAMDPEIESIVLVGGVVSTLGEHYRHTVVRLLDEIGLYGLSTRDPEFCTARVRLGTLDDCAGLRGAMIYASTLPSNSRSAVTARWVVRGTSTVEYEVVRRQGLLERDDAASTTGPPDEPGGPRRLVLIDGAVSAHHGSQVAAYFQRSNIDASLVIVDVSEVSKDMPKALAIVDAIETFGPARRSEPIVAIGGGVLLDVVGFAASLYRRGTPYVRVPTTLLAMVDAGVGVKTGVNLGPHRNRLGTYFAPVRTIIDTTFLKSLDERQLRSGLGEIVKVAVVGDARLFEVLERHGPELVRDRFQHSEAAWEVIGRAVSVMTDELAPNLWERDLYRLMDFGHSFTSELEMTAVPRLLHGEAVAMDIALSAALANRLGMLSLHEMCRIVDLLRTLELPTVHPLCTASMLERAMFETQRHRGCKLRLPLPVAIGRGRVEKRVTIPQVVEAHDALRHLVGAS